MLPLQIRVFHQGHGLGTVIAYNGIRPNQYFQQKPLEAIRLADQAGLVSSLFISAYSGDRYPNVVQFDSGYKDVYADIEVEVIN